MGKGNGGQLKGSHQDGRLGDDGDDKDEKGEERDEQVLRHHVAVGPFWMEREQYDAEGLDALPANTQQVDGPDERQPFEEKQDRADQ